MTSSERINSLHREHRATYIERYALARRGLDYTEAYARTAAELERIEADLADLIPAR